jgi:glutaredoxin 3
MLARSNGRRTVPQIFIGATHVGGSDDLHALERAGKLDALLAAS